MLRPFDFGKLTDEMRPLLIGVAIALAVYLCLLGTLIVLGHRRLAREVALLLPNLALLLKDLLHDPRVPRSSKALVWIGVVWVASPIDLIPEFIPFLGPLDDAVVVALILMRLVKTAGREVIEEHWRGDPATIAQLLRFAGGHANETGN
jgi:uncharacterized membrane protein YkvA (DUF1232 family)